MFSPAIVLNGPWEIGDGRIYDGTADVPGIARNPAAMQQGTLWFRRSVRLPQAPFARAFLLLGGARFCPSVYVNGDFCAQAQGGMGQLRLPLDHPACKPGAWISLEICLHSLQDVPPDDASRIPETDWWRTNIASCLWDDVSLCFTGETAIVRVIPRCTQSLSEVDVTVDAPPQLPYQLCMTLEKDGVAIAQTEWCSCEGTRATLRASHPPLACWDVFHPILYTMTVSIRSGGTESSAKVTVGVRTLCAQDKQLLLNGHPLKLRGTSLVWHRFCRDPQGRTLAFDRPWLCAALLDRLQALGGNFLRFHLGQPPEWLLDELDRRGMCAQVEWIFFHGMEASQQSMVQQWRELFALTARHPCVCIVQLWNETDGSAVGNAWPVLEQLRKEMPLPLLAHKDVLPVHKYWWSLFENLSLSYDGPDDFPLPAIADEFGGNYLDGDGMPGGYPEVIPAFARFLGKNNTAAQRFELQCLSNARVAEYWRILGIAGFATFCALSSPEDGSHHYLGQLAENRPKPVWQACSAAFAQESACLQLWDRAFVHGRQVAFPLWFFRDCPGNGTLRARVEVAGEDGSISFCCDYTAQPEPYGRACVAAQAQLPEGAERCTLSARLGDAVSSWPVRLYPAPSEPRLAGTPVLLLDGDAELAAFLQSFDMRLARPEEHCSLVLGGAQAVHRLAEDPCLCRQVEAAVSGGAGLLLLEVGPRALGEGYLSDKRAARLDGPTKSAEQEWFFPLPFGLNLRFHSLPEPESCCHRAPDAQAFWQGLQEQALQLSNGYRGGLNVPAASMTLEGIGREAYRAQWLARGASDSLFAFESSVAYELCGYYAFSAQPDAQAQAGLRARVRRFMEDAPSLAGAVNPEAEIAEEPIGRMYHSLPDRTGRLLPIAICGRNLERTAAFQLSLDGVKGKIILSQLLTSGRLHPQYAGPGLYDAHFDPEMVRFVLNMMLALTKGDGHE